MVANLPGIGRSTAGAILAFAFGQRHPILDGNVKRVLTRLHAIETPVLQRGTEANLWALAERYTSKTRVNDYTQAIMDLGATLCRTRTPDCPACPLQQDCAAYAQGQPERYPVRIARKTLPVREIGMLMIRDARGHVLLTRRPPAGVWGGLWGFPECAPDSSATDRCRDALRPADKNRDCLASMSSRFQPLPFAHHADSCTPDGDKPYGDGECTDSLV